MPTEAEWERAARGGIAGARFPWGDLITHSLANYQSAVQFDYDVSPTRGYHPLYGVGSLPFTAPVASFPANVFGLHDMTGNVAEQCWDWFGYNYYNGAATVNPRGPAATSGEGRVIRGGSATEFANLTRVAFRFVFAYLDNTTFHPAPGVEYCPCSANELPQPGETMARREAVITFRRVTAAAHVFRHHPLLAGSFIIFR